MRKLCSITLELNNAKVTRYPGNYDFYRTEKEQRKIVESLKRESKQVERELKKKRADLQNLNKSIDREIERVLAEERAAKKKQEAAAKSGDWIKAEAAVQFADVVSEANRRRKQAVIDRIASQTALSEKRDQAELYFEEGMYYDAAKYYFEAADAGYALSQKDRDNFEKAYATQKKRLQVMIDRCHKDIALGKSPIRPLADLEKEMRQLIEWNARSRARFPDRGM